MSWPSGLAFAGMALGWQAAMVVGMMTLVIALAVVQLTSWRRWPQPALTSCLLAACVLHHVLWRWTVENLSVW